MSTILLPRFRYAKQSEAGEPEPPVNVMEMTGRLEMSASGWILLKVPNSLGIGVYQSLNLPGLELPKKNGRYHAHISVIRPEELEAAGVTQRLDELGQRFKFQIKGLAEVNPMGWEEMDKVWFLRCLSPELKELRRSYNLPALPRKDGKNLGFHITVAVRRAGVLKGRKSKI